jgi:hypothetical protein
VAEHGQEQRQGREPVGTVAEETARLVEALGGWAEGLRGPAGDHPGTDRPDEPAAAPEADRPGAPGAGTRQTTRCEHCGVASRAGEALACQLCPVCQGIALLRSVQPETVERLADLAAALSGALRDIAADRFGQPFPPPPAAPPRGQRVQDIAVDDEDEPGTDDDEPGADEDEHGTAPTDRPRRT